MILKDLNRKERQTVIKRLLRLQKKAKEQKQAQDSDNRSKENTERFKDLCIGYVIQAQRLMKLVGSITIGQAEQLNRATEVMKDIQHNLLKLQELETEYNNHCSNDAYCRKALKPYSDDLKMIMEKTDVIIKGDVL